MHFLERVLTPLFMITPIMLLFELPDRDIYWTALALTAWSYVVHANIRVGFGRFWWLLSSPQYHRIHHSVRPEQRNKNFAVWFPIYVVMFGTADRPRLGEFPETGLRARGRDSVGGLCCHSSAGGKWGRASSGAIGERRRRPLS